MKRLGRFLRRVEDKCLKDGDLVDIVTGIGDSAWIRVIRGTRFRVEASATAFSDLARREAR